MIRTWKNRRFFFMTGDLFCLLIAVLVLFLSGLSHQESTEVKYRMLQDLDSARARSGHSLTDREVEQLLGRPGPPPEEGGVGSIVIGPGKPTCNPNRMYSKFWTSADGYIEVLFEEDGDILG